MSNSTERAAGPRPSRPGPRLAAGYFVAVILGAATVAALVLVLSSGDQGSTSASDGAFGTHLAGLETRRLQAGIPTMGDGAAGGAHIHPLLSVYVRGEQLPLPQNIGIDPSQPPEAMAGLHTHDSSGIIHVENAADPTLGQFFEIWGVPLSDRRLGPYEAKGDDRVRMWVDGEPSTEFGDLVMEDGQEIVLAFGSERQLPPGLSL